MSFPAHPSSNHDSEIKNEGSTRSVLELFRLDGKVALVTGAATGLGAAMAKALAQAGATLAVHGNRRPATDTAVGSGERRRPLQQT